MNSERGACPVAGCPASIGSYGGTALCRMGYAGEPPDLTGCLMRSQQCNADRDRDWVLAIAAALGTDSKFDVPIVPEPEPFRRLFAAMRSQQGGQAPSQPSAADELERRFNQIRLIYGFDTPATIRERAMSLEDFCRNTLAQVCALEAQLAKQRRIAELKERGTLANNLCPDHSDKVMPDRRCLLCEIEHHQKQLAARDEQIVRMREALHITSLKLNHAQELLSIAVCPHCDGSFSWSREGPRGEQIQEQCQWCHEKQAALSGEKQT